MEKKALCALLKEKIEVQLKLLVLFEQEEGNLRSILQQHDWDKIERKLRFLDNLSEKIMLIDDQRDKVYKELCKELDLAENVSFMKIINYLPENEQKYMQDLFQELKGRVESVKRTGQGIDRYIRVFSNFIQQTLEEALPGLKTKSYARNGKMNNERGQALLLNTHS